jgi:ATP-dependent Clp protease adaptor protein ClpS
MQQEVQPSKEAQKEQDILVERKIKEPTLYQIILWNDDFTTMEFVVQVLEEIFHYSVDKAIAIMQNIHEEGSAICGSFPLEIAETKVWQVHTNARREGYPLKADVLKTY